MDELSALLGQLPPEMLEQLMGLSTMDDKQGQLQQQMAQAQQLMQPNSNRSSPIGAALGGLGNVARGVGGGIQQQNVQGQQSKLMDDQLAARMAFIKALQQGGQQPQQPQQPQPFIGPQMPFGFGGKGPMP